MGTILILIGYYLDYKASPKSFRSDLLGGLTIVVLLFVSSVLLKLLNVSLLVIVFSVGVEIFLIFTVKALIDNAKNNKSNNGQ